MQHRAVLIAEDLTARFLNVISLMNRSIPMIAIQMSAFRIDNRVVLLFAKLLDLAVESAADDDTGSADEVDRLYWERKAGPDSIGASDKLLALIPNVPSPRYNKGHIAVGTSGRHFCWLHPRKRGHVVVDLLVGEEHRDPWLTRLEEAEVPAVAHRRDTHIKLPRLVQRGIAENEQVLRELLEHCELQSRAG